MSDVLSTYSKDKFQTNLKPVISNSLSPNLKKEFLMREKIVLTIEIRYSFISEVNKFKKKFPDFSFVSIYNSQIPTFQLKESTRLEYRFRKITEKVLLRFRSTSGRKRSELNDNITSITVFQSELEDVKSLACRLSKFEEKNLELSVRCKDLYKQLIESDNLLSQKDKDFKTLETLKDENEKLRQCIELINKHHVEKNNGKNVEELGKTQRYARIKEIKSMSQKALWFAETYGLTPKSLSFKTKTGEDVNISLGEHDQPELDEERIKEILYILDKFAIGDQAYHELSLKTNDLPKSYLIKNYRDQLNNSVHLERTPGNIPGAFLNFKREVENALHERYSHESTEETANPKAVKIKVSGDGTRVSRISNYIVMSFAIVDDDVTLSASQQRTLAIVKCHENYENLRDTLKPVFDQINELNNSPELNVNNRDYKIELLYGGDMKFLQLCLGLSGSTAEYACPWCKVSKGDRGDLSKEWNYYHTPVNCRTIDEIRSLSSKSKKLYSIKYPPLINIEPDHIVPDELHLTMRIFDVLLRNIIDDAADKDDKTAGESRKSDYLSSLVESIRSCGVPFQIWASKQRKGDREWTALRGDDMKKLMKLLPDKLMFNIHNETHDQTVKLWKDFSKIIQLINNPLVELKSPENVFATCKQWVLDFIQIGQRRKGYTQDHITPYIHTLAYHVPFFISNYGHLKKFSCQGVEKVNDNIKTIYQKKTNKLDCTVDTLKVRKRIENLSVGMERKRREYHKRKEDWWESELIATRTRKRNTVLKEIKEAEVKHKSQEKDTTPTLPESEDLNSLSVVDIKQKLFALGVKTRLRNKEKLVALLKENI